MVNFIAFGSAPRREADSQPISQLLRQAVSQTVRQASRQAARYTQFGFFQWQTWLQAVGRTDSVRCEKCQSCTKKLSSRVIFCGKCV